MAAKKLASTRKLKPPALDPATAAPLGPSRYPKRFRAMVRDRERRRLGDPLGLQNFGVNLLTLPPGAASSQRHWHTRQDEFIYVLEGEVTLVTDAGKQVLTAGMCAGFPAGKPDGHHLINRSKSQVKVLEVGDRTSGDRFTYSDIDMKGYTVVSAVFTRKSGKPY